MKNKFISFSVVIPTKDRLIETRQTVLSIYKQTHLPKEIVIVDDASDCPLTNDMLPPPPEGVNLVVLRNEVNKGGAYSLNRAMKHASGEFIAIIDSDDCYLPNALEEMAKFWENASEDVPACAIGFFWCMYNLIPYRAHIVTAPVSREALLSKGNILGGSSAICVRKSAADSVGGYPPINGSHDYGFWLRLSTLGPIETIAKPLMLYRSPTTNPLPTYTAKHRKQILALCSLYKLQPKEDREIMLPLLYSLFFIRFTKWGRKRYAIKYFIAKVRLTKKVGKDLAKISLSFILGTKLYDKILFHYAALRAKHRGERLLSGAGVTIDYINELIGDGK